LGNKKIKRKRVKIVKSQPMISTKMKKFNEVCCFSEVDFRRNEFKRGFEIFRSIIRGKKKNIVERKKRKQRNPIEMKILPK
jgi:hypothetical protein